DCPNLALAGGCALNSVANGKILSRTGFRKIYIPAAPGDAGGAIGAALLVWNGLIKINHREQTSRETDGEQRIGGRCSERVATPGLSRFTGRQSSKSVPPLMLISGSNPASISNPYSGPHFADFFVASVLRQYGFRPWSSAEHELCA